MSGSGKFAASCALLGGSTVALLLGNYFGADTAVQAGAAALLGKTAVDGVAGVATNLGSDAIKGGFGAVLEQLRPGADGRLPLNHDLARALRESQLDAIAYLLSRQERLRREFPDEFDDAVLTAFLLEARGWLKAQRKTVRADNFLSELSLEENLAEVRSLVEGTGVGGMADLYDDIGARACTLMLDELRAGLSRPSHLPDSFVDLANGRDGVGWLAAAQAFFAERLKTNPRIRVPLLLERFNTVIRGQQHLEELLTAGLSSVRQGLGDLGARLAAMERHLADGSGRDGDGDRADMVAEIIAGLADGWDVEAIVRSAIVSARAPHGIAQTARQVSRRFVALSEASFHGRETQIESLDQFVEGPGGLLILAGPAGAGKSSLLAHWVERRLRLGEWVAHHFVSGAFDRTTRPEEMIGNLLAQVKGVDGLEAEGASARGQELFAALERSLAGHEGKLIIVLDGLDEAAELIEPFVELSIAARVYVIVSGRAAVDENPVYLRAWAARLAAGLPGSRLDLRPIEREGIEAWLAQVDAAEEPDDRRAKATTLLQSTSGLPLYLTFLLNDAGLSEDELPDSFRDYVLREIERPARSGEPDWTAADLRFLALLSKALGPLRASEIQAVQPGFDPLLERSMHHRFQRWFTIQGSRTDPTFSLAHPQLAEVFADVLAEAAQDAELRLVEWAEGAWRPSGTKRRPQPGASYALDWLVPHLVRLGAESTKDAVALLSNPHFLVEQLRDRERAGSRLRDSLSHWVRAPQHLKSDSRSRNWTWFWTENESMVRELIETQPDLDASRIVAGIIGDRLLDESLPPRALWGHVTPSSRLLRVHYGPHEGRLLGLNPAGDRALTFGQDNYVRFWDAFGDEVQAFKCPGAEIAAADLISDDTVLVRHKDGRFGLWALSGELLRSADSGYGQPFDIRFLDAGFMTFGIFGSCKLWSEDFECLETTDGCLTWYGSGESCIFVGMRDGEVLLFGHDGRLVARNSEAHSDDLRMYSVPGGYVSLGADGVLCLWDKDLGLRRRVQAHQGVAMGIEVTEDSIFTSGDDGHVCRWSHELDLLRRHECAEDRWIRKLERFGNHLFSLGNKGVLRRWSMEGQPKGLLDGAGSYLNGICAHDGTVITWSVDRRSIAFWPPDGDEAVVRQAHSAQNSRVHVAGIKEFGRYILTWGHDGRLVVWNTAGEALGSAAGRAGLTDILFLGEAIVGASGHVLQFWRSLEDVLSGEDPIASRGIETRKPHRDGMVVAMDDGYFVLVDCHGNRKPLDAKPRDPKDHRPFPLSYQGGIVSFDKEGDLRFFDEAGELLARHSLPGNGIFRVITHGDRVATIGPAGIVRLWSVDGRVTKETGRLHGDTIDGSENDGRHIVTWGPDNSICVLDWDLNLLFRAAEPISDSQARLSGADVDQPLSGRLKIDNVALGEKIWASVHNGSVRIWEWSGVQIGRGETWENIGEVAIVDDHVICVDWEESVHAFDSTGKKLESAQKPNTNHYTKLRDSNGFLVVDNGMTVEVWTKSFSPVSPAILAGDVMAGFVEAPAGYISWNYRGDICLWDREWAIQKTLPGPHLRRVLQIKLCGDRFFSSSSDGLIRCWTLSGEPVDAWLVPGARTGIEAPRPDRVFAINDDLWIYPVES